MKWLALALLAVLASGCTLNLTDARARAKAAEGGSTGGSTGSGCADNTDGRCYPGSVDDGSAIQVVYSVLPGQSSAPVLNADVTNLVPDGRGGMWMGVNLSGAGATLIAGTTPLASLSAAQDEDTAYAIVRLAPDGRPAETGALPAALGGAAALDALDRSGDGNLYAGTYQPDTGALGFEVYAPDGGALRFGGAPFQPMLQTDREEGAFAVGRDGMSACAADLDGGATSIVVQAASADFAARPWSASLSATGFIYEKALAFQGGRLVLGGWYQGEVADGRGAAVLPASASFDTVGYVVAFNASDGGVTGAATVTSTPTLSGSPFAEVVSVKSTDAGLLVGGLGYGTLTVGADEASCTCATGASGLFAALLDVDAGFRCLGMACAPQANLSFGYDQYALSPEGHFVIAGSGTGQDAGALAPCEIGPTLTIAEFSRDGLCLGDRAGNFTATVDALGFTDGQLWLGGGVSALLGAPTLELGGQAATNPGGGGSTLLSTGFLIRLDRAPDAR